VKRGVTAEMPQARFRLEESEMIWLMATFIASGRWVALGLTEADAKDWLLNFIHSLKVHGDSTTKALFLQMQNTLMALRKDSFDRIQQEPPFSVFGRQTLTQLDRSWVQGGDNGFLSEWNRIFARGWEQAAAAKGVAVVAGGPGHSVETAFVVNAIDHETVVNSEYWYLYHAFGRGWTIGTRKLTKPDQQGRQFDVLHVRWPDGARREFYFDVTGSLKSSPDGLKAQAESSDVVRQFGQRIDEMFTDVTRERAGWGFVIPGRASPPSSTLRAEAQQRVVPSTGETRADDPMIGGNVHAGQGSDTAPDNARRAPSMFGYKLLATFLIVGACWWLWHPLGASIGILFAGSFRQPIVRRAAFWDGKTILGVGALWGLSMAVAVRMVSGLATDSLIGSIALCLEGLVAVYYVGYSPDPVDLFMYNKAGQTATVGTICYLLAMICLIAFRAWAG
jgi:hypothetical protein